MIKGKEALESPYESLNLLRNKKEVQPDALNDIWNISNL